MSSSVTIEPVYVVDTHALIWYLTNERKLGKDAARIFAAAERGETQLILSAIVITKMYYAGKKANLFPNFNQTFKHLRSNPQYQFHAFTVDDVLDFDQDVSIPEMHDRIIAGLARRLGAPLNTSDPLIAKASAIEVVW